MLNTIIFSNEITVWWDKQWELADDVSYRLLLNGKAVATTTKTHYSFHNLFPETAYEIKVERTDGESVAEVLGILHLTTPKEKKRLDVTSYGAVGDGQTLNTESLQRAIDACGADECVYFPAGIYMSGALDLHSDMELYLDQGAILQGTAKVDDYLPRRWGRFEGTELMCYSSLLNMGTLDHTAGPNCRNIVIRGGGAILGGGAAHCEAVIESELARLKNDPEQSPDDIKALESNRALLATVRPRLMNISNCENVVITGLTMGYGASWNVHFMYSRNIVTYDCKIVSHDVWNGDGWNPDSSENCVIFNTEFNTGDNSIAIKSGKNLEGIKIGRPSVGIRVFDCHGGKSLGIGSEMSGGVSNIYIWDCDFSASVMGLSVKLNPERGGYMRNIVVRNCRFSSIRARSRYFVESSEPAENLSVVEDFLFQNIELTGSPIVNDGKKHPSEILLLAGLDEKDHYFNRFTFDGLRIHNRENGEPQKILIRNTKNLTFKNISFD